MSHTGDMEMETTVLQAPGYRVRIIDSTPTRFVTEWEVDRYTGPPLHWHPTMTEGWEVLEGTMSVEIDGTRRTLTAGDSAVAQPGVRHRFSATGHVRWRQTNEPRLDHERLFRLDHQRALRRGAEGRPGPVEAIRIFALMDGWIVGPPLPLQRLLRATGKALNRRAGLGE